MHHCSFNLIARRRRRVKTVANASRDLISELPVEVKDRILECLPTRDATRTALLSSHWNHVWLQHERLTFGCEFVQSFQHSQDDEGRTLVSIINNILFSRAGPVKKFTLEIDTAYDPSSLAQQFDFDRWCFFLSTNGVEELNLSLYSYLGLDYQLPFCLLSCKTIKQLIVAALLIDLPVNAVGIFFNVTSLAFFNAKFKRSVNGIASSISIPKLEKLAFELCREINKFEIISPPKLEILYTVHSIGGVVESRWLTQHLKAIKTLWLCGSLLRYMDVSMFPTAINLQVIKLYKLSFGCGKQLTITMQLLQKCPNLCELGIMVEEESNSWGDDKEVASTSTKKAIRYTCKSVFATPLQV
ncbi:F-box/FBD/LRR-repeat protein At1g13570-like [Ipomoea triloba]|uniref:F-box/FBD/LRR-repeat protein At1g13570-like n=1 Tax=Ipomoea triloba TaxID=35885 RepID=UPI00125DCCED|nr:F-box/FBD/LRR-repeat protein At1g13570-like [Ipomoea triloba]